MTIYRATDSEDHAGIKFQAIDSESAYDYAQRKLGTEQVIVREYDPDEGCWYRIDRAGFILTHKP